MKLSFLLLMTSFLSISSSSLPSFYHTSEDIDNSLIDLQTTCKQGYKLETILDEPRIYLVTITSKDRTDPEVQNKQKIFYLFGEHPRELISPETGLNLVNTLCGIQKTENIDIDKLLKENIFQIVINANPLGRVEVEKGDYCKRTNENGVDLNRNWDDHWQRFSLLEDPDLNPGLLAFSEIETQKLQEALVKFSPKVFVSVHSGQLAMFTPYAYEKLEPMVNGDNMMKALEGLNQEYCNCKMGPAGLKVGYLSSGTSLDYVYDNIQAPYSYAFEIYSRDKSIPALEEGFLQKSSKAAMKKQLDNKQFMLRPFQISFDMVQKMQQSMLISEQEDCFSQFNPGEEQAYNIVVENWTKVLLRLPSEVLKAEELEKDY